MTDAKLLEEGRRLKREIDAAYEQLYEALSDLGSMKRSIMAKERALHTIQDRLLSTCDMGNPSDDVSAKRRRMIKATDDE